MNSRALRKLHNNLLGRRAAGALGSALYLRYWASLVAHLPEVLRQGDLRPVDLAMGPLAREFRYRGRPFVFDCDFCDRHLNEGSYAFGGAREIYVRDCYFRWHPPWVYTEARTVVDLGANRGAFSALMSAVAQRIVCVDCQEQYVPILRHNLAANGFTDFHIETAMIGSGGKVPPGAEPIAMSDLFDRYDLEHVDLIKLDIEGSEFSLFEDTRWLRRVRALSMEVHPAFGEPSTIVDSLRRHGFSVTQADEDLRLMKTSDPPAFVYAQRRQERPTRRPSA